MSKRRINFFRPQKHTFTFFHFTDLHFTLKEIFLLSQAFFQCNVKIFRPQKISGKRINLLNISTITLQPKVDHKQILEKKSFLGQVRPAGISFFKGRDFLLNQKFIIENSKVMRRRRATGFNCRFEGLFKCFIFQIVIVFENFYKQYQRRRKMLLNLKVLGFIDVI